MIELDNTNPFDQSYHDMLARILKDGVRKADRTGTGTLSVFGHFQRFDLSQGFPLITTKKIHLKSIIHELLWMISGSSNIKYLKDNGVKIWDEWADEDGNLGPVYGSQWRAWGGEVEGTGERWEVMRRLFLGAALDDARESTINFWERRLAGIGIDVPKIDPRRRYPSKEESQWDYVILMRDAFYEANGKRPPTVGVDQIEQIVDKLRNKPWDRRIMLSAWNVGEISRMKLPPCHFNAQFNVEPQNGIYGYDTYMKTLTTPAPPNGDEFHKCIECGREDSSTINGCDLCLHCGAKEPPLPGRLNCVMNIRSWDTFLGGPFNIAQYALLTMMLAQVADLEPGELCICSGDTHVYLNHLEQVRLQLTRTPKAPPRMVLDPSIKEIDDFKFEHFKLEDYEHHPHIKGEVSV